MTGNETKPNNCSLYRVRPNTILQSGWNTPPGVRYDDSIGKTGPAEVYDALVSQVWPILTVVMPPANNSRQSGIGEAYATMTCISARSNIKQGSRTPPPLPKAKPVNIGTNYGVKVGVPVAIVGALIIAAIIGWWFWRKRRASRNAQKEAEKSSDYGSSLQKDGSEVYQMGTGVDRVQLPADHKVEMSAGQVARPAIGTDGKPLEMMGSVPDNTVAGDAKSRP